MLQMKLNFDSLRVSGGGDGGGGGVLAKCVSV